MNNLQTPKPPRKLDKHRIRCFHCKKDLSIRDGNWRHWEHQEVFLCAPCDRSTAEGPERRRHRKGV